jgi:hypothetical protein
LIPCWINHFITFFNQYHEQNALSHNLQASFHSKHHLRRNGLQNYTRQSIIVFTVYVWSKVFHLQAYLFLTASLFLRPNTLYQLCHRIFACSLPCRCILLSAIDSEYLITILKRRCYRTNIHVEDVILIIT